ncbi:unnamed protein product [Bursaphelenchus xylophilus]|uniref:(pine wood nematode) hypothetical protein n=1 Tax=Bursaphelenchus xylophilus TaxID=6326 RepID=A0A1I7S6H4_BURXY|nr:unnamed protein product [Bursaphelenchus xylophilus]CAG9127993.1 unnamed protein product [Bursaphelenchus xylophilus]
MLARTLAVWSWIGLLAGVSCVLDGDPVDWSRHGYLVKIVAKLPDKSVKLCTGALISGSLVLTSADCVVDSETSKDLEEFAVITLIKKHKRRLYGLLVEKTEKWAVLRIDTVPTDKLCPPAPQPPRVLRLNQKPSLKSSSTFYVPISQILKSKCYLLGFKTEDDASNFYRQKQVYRLDLYQLMEPRSGDIFYRSLVKENYTACFEDTGAPLICNTPESGTLLVGYFQSLGRPISPDAAELTTPISTLEEACSGAYEMNFDLVSDDERLVKLIEKEDLGPFVDIYHKCGFVNSESS